MLPHTSRWDFLFFELILRRIKSFQQFGLQIKHLFFFCEFVNEKYVKTKMVLKTIFVKSKILCKIKWHVSIEGLNIDPLKAFWNLKIWYVESLQFHFRLGPVKNTLVWRTKVPHVLFCEWWITTSNWITRLTITLWYFWN